MITFRNDEWVETEPFVYQNSGELVTDPSEYVPNSQVLKAVKSGMIKAPMGAYDFPDGKDNGTDLTFLRSGADIEEKLNYIEMLKNNTKNSIEYVPKNEKEKTEKKTEVNTDKKE